MVGAHAQSIVKYLIGRQCAHVGGGASFLQTQEHVLQPVVTPGGQREVLLSTCGSWVDRAANTLVV